MNTMTRDVLPDALRRAQNDLDSRFDEIARQYAGHPRSEVLGVLEREVCAAGVTPVRPDLSALARQIADTPTAG
jgi:hypothetical protein